MSRRRKRKKRLPPLILDLEAGWLERGPVPKEPLDRLAGMPALKHPAFPGTQVPDPVGRPFAAPQEYSVARRKTP